MTPQTTMPPNSWASSDRHDISMTIQRHEEGTRVKAKDAYGAWKHCKDVSRDDARAPDLYDLLSHSIREKQYSYPPQGWPAQLRLVSPMVNEMPKMVMEKYAACQSVAFCGVFPEIKRAWASVDSSLFLWRFDRWQDVPIEYGYTTSVDGGLKQSIVAAGVLAPKPGVFEPAIQHILVLCTTTEVAMLGLSHEGGDCEDLVVQPLPQYVVSSDNVPMISVAATKLGRIFLGGSDGNLYEILYSAKNTWRSKRCYKICHTKGIRSYMPSFLPPSLFGQTQPLVHIAIDDERHILYARSQNSMIQVFDLGLNGKDAPNKVAETTDFAVDASRALGGREVFGRGAGDKKGARVIYMAPVPTKSSRRIQLLTVTADGRRVYWSTMSSRSSTSQSRPDRLRAEVARAAVTNPSTGRSYHSASIGRSLEVVAACAASDALLLAESHAEGSTSLFVVSKDTTIPPPGTATGAHITVSGLRESISQLEFALPGETCDVREIPRPMPLLPSHDPLLLSYLDSGPAQRFAVATTAGVAEVEILRPTDTLSQILLENNATTLETFFASYGATEACAMCIILASAGAPSKQAAPHAEAALDNPKLCGHPETRPPSQAVGQEDEAPAAHLPGGFDMGAVVPIAEPEWSAAHKGLCLVVSRLLRGIWDEPLFSYSRSSPELLNCALNSQMLEGLYYTLKDLQEFLGRFIHKRKTQKPQSFFENSQSMNKRQKLEDALRKELQRTEQVTALVTRVADGCFLILQLLRHNISRLTARIDSEARAKIRTLRFTDWITSDDGQNAAKHMISVLISEHLNDSGGFSHDLANALQQGCPSYFDDEDRRYSDARTLLRKAEGAVSAADREVISREAVSLLMKVPLACDLGQVIPQLAMLRSIDYIIDLTIQKANALDPTNAASEEDPTLSQQARSRRNDLCYLHICDLLRVLKSKDGTSPPPSFEAFVKSLKDGEKEKLASSLINKIASVDDPCLHENVYRTLIDINCIQDLLNMNTDTLENYLFQGSGLAVTLTGALAGPLSAEETAHAEVLAKYYVKNGDYAASAGVLEHLASQVADLVEPPRPSLHKRVEYLESAVLQARSCGDSALVDRLSTRVNLGHIQINLESVLRNKGLITLEGNDEGSEFVHEISRTLLSLEILYNDIARKFSLWRECLELINVAAFDDLMYVRQLWDLYLTGEWFDVWNSYQDMEPTQRSLNALGAMCSAAATLGRLFYPNEKSVPIISVLTRMEQASAGLWPRECEHPDGDAAAIAVKQAVLAICGDSYEEALKAYDALLAVRSSDPLGEDLHDHEFRFRVLCSAKNLVDDALDIGLDLFVSTGNLAQERRLLGILASACEAYAAESRQLSLQAGNLLATEFEEASEKVNYKIVRQMQAGSPSVF